MTIGKNIFRFRKEKGMTQAELGEKLGVSNQAISKWESGMSAPDISLLPFLADVFECSIDDLFDYIPKRKFEPTFYCFRIISNAFCSKTNPFLTSRAHCFRVLRSAKWDKLWSSKTP